MLTAKDFLNSNPDKNDDTTIDSIIENYVYPGFHEGKTSVSLYENILIQEGVDFKVFKDRLKELKFKVSAGSIGMDKVMVIKLK